MNEKNNQILFSLFDKYNLSNQEREYLLSIIQNIYLHDEFQKRLTSEFSHHDQITLGYHILEVTIVTYILSKKRKINISTALQIAMFHDLYTLPWQNNPQASVNSFFHKHGFRHPIESVINALTWYPDIFHQNKESEIIIDGIVHHMFPLPVVSFSKKNQNLIELKNNEYIKKLDAIHIDMLEKSSNRFKIGEVSICTSLFHEGKIVSLADKMVSISNLKNSSPNGISALITGKNKTLKKLK